MVNATDGVIQQEKYVTVVLTKGGRVPGYGFNPQIGNAPCRVTIDVAITLVLTGRATYPDGGVERLREIERGEMGLAQLPLRRKYTLVAKLSTKIVIETAQKIGLFVIKNWKSLSIIIIPLVGFVYGWGVSHHWWPFKGLFRKLIN